MAASLETTSRPLIGLSTGGTGGHIFPAVALANHLLERDYRVIFFTDTRGKRFLDKYPHLPYHEIPAATISKKPLQLLKAGFKILSGYLKAHKFLKNDQPDVMVAFGGYPCFPAAFAGAHQGIPLILHEQNALMGRANRFLAKSALAIGLSFSETALISSALQQKVTVTGNPIRTDVMAIASKEFQAPDEKNPFHILVTGGSQGSRILGQVIPKALSLLPEALRARIIMTQQCRADNIDDAKKIYQEAGVQATLLPFIDDMPAQLSKAHLVIARAGASTVAELTALGRPALYVPLAASIDGDQSLNARQIVEQDAGWLMEERSFTPQALATKLETILNDPAEIKHRADAAKELGHLDATEKLGDLVRRFVSDRKDMS